MSDQSNAILAAIDRLGGGSDGVKRIGALLNLTTTRVYKMREQGVVKKPEHAKILALATGIPFEQFLLREAWPTNGTDPGGGRHDPKEPTPSEIRTVARPDAGVPDAAHVAHLRQRKPRSRSGSIWTITSGGAPAQAVGWR